MRVEMKIPIRITKEGVDLAQGWVFPLITPVLDNDCPVSSPFCNPTQYLKKEYANKISAIGD
jgi:hypothetical protein